MLNTTTDNGNSGPLVGGGFSIELGGDTTNPITNLYPTADNTAPAPQSQPTRKPNLIPVVVLLAIIFLLSKH